MTAPDQRLVLLLVMAEKNVSARLDARRRDLGVGLSGLGVLFALDASPGMTMTALAAQLGLSLAGMSGLLTRLERDGLVERRRDEADQRATRVHLSAAGEQVAARGAAGIPSVTARLREGFTREEMAVVTRWLHHVAELGDLGDESLGNPAPQGDHPGNGALGDGDPGPHERAGEIAEVSARDGCRRDNREPGQNSLGGQEPGGRNVT